MFFRNAIKLSGGSTLKLWEGIFPGDTSIGHILINHDCKAMSPGYRAIVLEEKSMLLGAKHIEFFTKNSNNEVVPMPEGQTIVESPNDDTTVIE